MAIIKKKNKPFVFFFSFWAQKYETMMIKKYQFLQILCQNKHTMIAKILNNIKFFYIFANHKIGNKKNIFVFVVRLKLQYYDGVNKLTFTSCTGQFNRNSPPPPSILKIPLKQGGGLFVMTIVSIPQILRILIF